MDDDTLYTPSKRLALSHNSCAVDGQADCNFVGIVCLGWQTHQ